MRKYEKGKYSRWNNNRNNDDNNNDNNQYKTTWLPAANTIMLAVFKAKEVILYIFFCHLIDQTFERMNCLEVTQCSV